MGTYVQLMPRMVQRRMEEMESKAAENAKAAEAAAAANVAPPATEATQPPQSPITISPSTQVPAPLLSPSATDVAPEAHGSFLKPAGLDIPVEFDAAVSKSTTATDVKLSAATALTPATEAVYPSVLNDAGNGPSYAAGFPQPQIAPVSVLSNTTSTSADVPVSTIAATKSTESLPGQERAPQLPPPPGQ